ncbi:hypothetical protein, partial [Ruegeria sp. HKCCD6604]|uniref:hypothetical protein n=1 Tax=Ruegeria sp. HKCCD6604 TaxID=2683000 RepID=UPI0014909EB2
RDESGVAIEPEEWSARWVLRKTIEKKSFNDSGVVQSLVTLEMAQSDAFIGSVRDESGVAIEPEEWSARWVLRKTIEKKSFNDIGLVQSLVTLEMAQSDAFIGSIRDENGVAIEPEKWSVRWAARTGMQRSQEFFDSYLNILIIASGLDPIEDWGDSEYSDEGSINKLLLKRFDDLGRLPNPVLISFSNMDIDLLRQKIGDYRTPEKYTVRWYFRQSLATNPDETYIWQCYFKTELNSGVYELGEIDRISGWSLRAIGKKTLDRIGDERGVEQLARWFFIEKEQENGGLSQWIQEKVIFETSRDTWERATASIEADAVKKLFE